MGFPLEFTIPTMVQDEAHYDLFKNNPDRYPLVKVQDLMPYLSIVYEKDRYILRTKDLGVPPEMSKPGTIRFPDASVRSDAPTSSWYWTRAKISDPSGGRGATDWFLIDSGNKEILVKKSLADEVGLDLSPGRNSRNFDSNASIEFSEATLSGGIENAKINVREDSARFGRGGEPRNLMGGSRFNGQLVDSIGGPSYCFAYPLLYRLGYSPLHIGHRNCNVLIWILLHIVDSFMS